MNRIKLEGKRKKGSDNVTIRYSYTNKGRKYFFTNIVIPKDDFDKSNLEKPVKKDNPNHKVYNKLTTELVNRIMLIQSEQALNKIDPTAELVHYLFHSKRDIQVGQIGDPQISSLFSEFMAAKNYPAGTSRIFTLLFAQFEGYFKRLSVGEFDIKKWAEFKNYLHKKEKLSANTVCIRLSKLKTFIKYLKASGYQVPLSSFPMPKEEIKMTAMDTNDLNLVLCYSPLTESMQVIKDLCMFQCFTGLRISDLKRLNSSHIHVDSFGNHTIRMNAFKTGEKLYIPLREHALEILKRYDYKLPKLADAFYNREIKKLLKHAGVTRLHEWESYDENGRKVYKSRPLYEIFTNHCSTRSAIYYFLQYFSPHEVARIVGKSHDTIMEYYLPKATEADIESKAKFSNFWPAKAAE
jgi:integrase